MIKTNNLMASWNLKEEVKKLEESAVKTALTTWLGYYEVHGIQSIPNLIFRSNLQGFLERTDAPDDDELLSDIEESIKLRR